ncbi:MAG: hypothetical protein Q8P22_01395 [Chloroflexota bacterium]|nr:hypothetical protein [Chloroflexota bacterium]
MVEKQKGDWCPPFDFLSLFSYIVLMATSRLPGNPNWVPGMPAPSTSWLPGFSGNPDTPPLTSQELQQFLDLLADAHSVSSAARELHRHRDAFYEHRSSNPDFARAWDAAIEARGDWYEDRLRGRASGEEKGDTLADIIGLKMTGRFIEPQYRDKAIQVNIAISARPYANLSMEELTRRLAEAEAAALKAEAEARTIEVKALPEPSQDTATDVTVDTNKKRGSPW